jgi:CRISPR system Cascade subunit CasC
MMNKQSRLYLDIHILQTVPPSCVNRDDTGSPKTAIYGGATRARVSSQAWKKAVRRVFGEELFAPEALGKRTKRIVALVSDAMRARPDCPKDPEAAVATILKTAGLKEGSLGAGTSAPLFFMSAAQAKALAELAIENPKADKKAVQAALLSAPSVDLALFGRMVADEANLNVDAACQVAHAISTHAVQTEYDYFTAVDDYPDAARTDAGAAMIGTIEFNAATLYRYATIALHELNGHLGGDATAAACAFVDAFARSMPEGKQNTFANRTLPSAMLVMLRTDQPVNLVGAFEAPVQKGEEGYVARSAQKLCLQEKRARAWVNAPKLTLALDESVAAVEGAEAMPSLKALLNRLSSAIAEAL